MSFYEKYILPKFLDFACNLKGFQNKRSQIVPHAYGTVLEIGIGRNFLPALSKLS
jgi:hypothetical protein